MDAKQRLESHDAAAGKAVPGNPLGLGLVLVGAAAAAVSMFLPLAQSVYGLPILGKNTLFQIFGWYLLLIPFFLALIGYQASQGKRVARWSLIGGCAVAAVGVVLVATDRGLRTFYPVASGGTPDTSQPGLVTGLAIAIYVAGAGVAVAFIGALALFQRAGNQITSVGPAGPRRNGVRETRVPSAPVGNPEPEHRALEAESSAVEVESHAGEAQPRAQRSRLQSTWPLIASIVVVVATVASYFLLGRTSPTSQPSTTAQTPPSLTPAQAALKKLLLSPDQINTAMGMTGLTVGGTANAMLNVASTVSDKACQPIASPAEAEVFEGSGWSAVLGQEVREPGRTYRHGVDQFVVSFPSAQDADAFYAASSQRWLACANRQYTIAMMGQVMVHTVGPVSNTDGTLSVTHTQPHGAAIYTCQRALTVANNIVIDVAACSLDQFDSQSDAAVNIAHQIAAKVPVGNNNPAPSTAPETSITGSAAAPSVAESALQGLLLSPDEINTAMGATGMTIANTWKTMFDDTANVSPAECLPVNGPAEDTVYSGSGWTAVLIQILEEPPPQDRNHRVVQSVVLFASADAAAAFVHASSQSWMACANRSFTTTFSGGPASWTAGPVSTANGILEITETEQKSNGWRCQQALTASNNVVVDIGACSYNTTNQVVSMAGQIAAKVRPM